MPTVPTCPNCRAPLQVHAGQARTFCSFCGAQVQLDTTAPGSAEQPVEEPGGPRLAEAISMKRSPTVVVSVHKAGTALPAWTKLRLKTALDTPGVLPIDLVAGDPDNPSASRPLASFRFPVRQCVAPGDKLMIELEVQVDRAGNVSVVYSETGTDNVLKRDGFAVRVA